MHWRLKLPATVLAFTILLVIDRYTFRPFEPSIANKYPCSNANISTVASNLDTSFNDLHETRYRLPDGTTVRKVANTGPTTDLLILTLIKDASSYGHDQGRPTRTFQNYLELLMSSGIDLNHVSLGVATESENEHLHIETSLRSLNRDFGFFPRITLLLNMPPASTADRNERHQLTLNAQTARRSYIAQLRNMLTFHSLRSEPHVLWLDADVNYLSPNVIQTMLAQQYLNPAAGLVTARCQEGPTFDYDKNAWAGERFQQSDGRVATRRNVAELIKGTSANDLIPLNSVGGTILLIRSSLVSKGLVFPATPIVGAEWTKAGWDGIETEGLCVLARDLESFGDSACFVLGGHHHVGHTNF